jgi:hypothetical protein
MNCATFAGEWVLRVTGTDPLEGYRGRAETEAEAMVLLSDLDRTLYEALRKRFGDPLHPARAQRGDIAYRKAERACGIYLTSGARMLALFLTDGGFAMHRARETDWAFRVTGRIAGWQRHLNEYILEAQARYAQSGFGWKL